MTQRSAPDSGPHGWSHWTELAPDEVSGFLAEAFVCRHLDSDHDALLCSDIRAAASVLAGAARRQPSIVLMTLTRLARCHELSVEETPLTPGGPPTWLTDAASEVAGRFPAAADTRPFGNGEITASGVRLAFRPRGRWAGLSQSRW